MQDEQTSSNAISEAALRVFSRKELVQMPEVRRMNLMILIERKLKQGNSLDDVLGVFERPLALVK